MLHQDIAWRAMTGYDLPAVQTIAGRVHPGLFETPEVLAERQRLYRNGCYILEFGGEPAGYVLSHPWSSGSLPALNVLLDQLPTDPDTYYLHDLALLPVARRVGAAGHIVSALTKHAAATGFSNMSLVAVNGSRAFWERHGFTVADAPRMAAKLRSYEPTARLMVKTLSGTEAALRDLAIAADRG